MSLLIGVLGSLGLFLYGMKVMSEGLQRAAGDGLRELLEKMTKNRFFGVLTGFLTTSLIQSSSATTVMLVGFANAGLVSLRQAISVIMGANIGTTITFWLVSYLGFKFSVTGLALPAVGAGMFLLLLRGLKKEDVGVSLIGFGILFLGLDFLKDSVPDLKSHPEYFEFVTRWGGDDLSKLVLFFIFGTILTIVIQSSSAAGAITLALAYKGWIDYPSACAIVLGENVGTTVTANMAAIGGNVHARRTAIAHLCFNLIGVAWMAMLFVPFTKLVYIIMPGSPEDTSTLPQHLALFHTLFNVSNTALLIGFIPALEKIVSRSIKEKESEQYHSSVIKSSSALPKTGELNLVAAEKEVQNMGKLVGNMFRGFQEVYRNPDVDLSQKVKDLKEMEDVSDVMAHNITSHLMLCSSENLRDRSAGQVTSLIRVVAELESVGDCVYRLVKLTAKRHRKNRQLSTRIESELNEYSEWVLQLIEFTTSNLGTEVTPADLTRGAELEKEINNSRKKLRKFAIARMSETDKIPSEILYIDLLDHMERIGNHCLNALLVIYKPVLFQKSD